MVFFSMGLTLYVINIPLHVGIYDDMGSREPWQFPLGIFLLIQQEINHQTHQDLTG